MRVGEIAQRCPWLLHSRSVVQLILRLASKHNSHDTVLKQRELLLQSCKLLLIGLGFVKLVVHASACLAQRGDRAFRVRMLS